MHMEAPPTHGATHCQVTRVVSRSESRRLRARRLQRVTPVATNVDTPGMPNAEVALQRSMDETATRARPDRRGAAASRGRRMKPTVVPGELDRVVAMSWNGGLDGAVRKLAETIGYRAVVTGTASRAVNVVVDPAPQRVYDILHGLGDQAGDAATSGSTRSISFSR